MPFYLEREFLPVCWLRGPGDFREAGPFWSAQGTAWAEGAKVKWAMGVALQAGAPGSQPGPLGVRLLGLGRCAVGCVCGDSGWLVTGARGPPPSAPRPHVTVWSPLGLCGPGSGLAPKPNAALLYFVQKTAHFLKTGGEIHNI